MNNETNHKSQAQDNALHLARLVLEVAEVSNAYSPRVPLANVCSSRDKIRQFIEVSPSDGRQYHSICVAHATTPTNAMENSGHERVLLYVWATSFQAVRVEGGYPNLRPLILSLHLSSRPNCVPFPHLSRQSLGRTSCESDLYVLELYPRGKCHLSSPIRTVIWGHADPTPPSLIVKCVASLLQNPGIREEALVSVASLTARTHRGPETGNEILSLYTVFGDAYTLICLVKDTEGRCRSDRKTYIIIPCFLAFRLL
ncbi:hypothetical protein SCHPADRAFT_74748 [Schizopora paradoxa]|uniref:Uncharacterized protein n=1 Tax=Schizopora paradoxa TaxID=27342 RepID=A0A0H2S5Z4_9AGAM|nr:hypothetical protein SCHPADRAFT_74748 [Schizopora paradoxa]